MYAKAGEIGGIIINQDGITTNISSNAPLIYHSGFRGHINIDDKKAYGQAGSAKISKLDSIEDGVWYNYIFGPIPDSGYVLISGLNGETDVFCMDIPYTKDEKTNTITYSITNEKSYDITNSIKLKNISEGNLYVTGDENRKWSLVINSEQENS
jgi:hypothetical protein